MTDRYENIRRLLREYATAAASWGVDRCDMERLRLERECTPDTIRALLAERDALAAALEAAREDAERWRAARRMLADPMFTSDAFADALCSRNAKSIDAAIDQARGKENANG